MKFHTTFLTVNWHEYTTLPPLYFITIPTFVTLLGDRAYQTCHLSTCFQPWILKLIYAFNFVHPTHILIILWSIEKVTLDTKLTFFNTSLSVTDINPVLYS